MTEPAKVDSRSMEEKIHECRRVLVDDPINKRSFERRFRPDLERLQSSAVTWGDEICAIRRFTVYGRVWELVEFLIGGLTDTTLIINFQTQRILEFSRHIDAEATLVDQMQDSKEKLG